ncbi:MAG: ADP-ribosylglycohydrolase family protein [Helicobacteraceae bacterium]|jgi:ADP-ribosylglycohydrolase|nr:ADP-ribosylglycohydrolase family protein [Helicobacteraceae bacterium]
MGNTNYIIGAIAGDIIGSVYEWNNVKTVDFDLFTEKSTFTDDSVLTLATMDCILSDDNYKTLYQKYARDYPLRGFGGSFCRWIYSDNPKPYNSWGNGSAMRVSPVGWAFNTIEEVVIRAKASAEVTHNHPEGIKGAQAVASAIFMARNNKTKDEIKEYVEKTFGYDLDRTIDEIRPKYKFDVSCQGSVPESVIAFLESDDYESAIRLAISLGGDSDTIACITGAIAEAFYKTIPENIVQNVLERLPNKLINLLERFSLKYK